MLQVDTPTLTDTQTLARAHALVKTHLPLEAQGYCCSTDTLTDALLAVAARGDTLETVCQDLAAMPTSQTLRTYFNEALTHEQLDLVECRVNRMRMPGEPHAGAGDSEAPPAASERSGARRRD